MIVQDRLPDSSVCSLHHIRSHQDYVGDESWVQWACSANDTADLLATWALENLPPNVRHHQQKASEAVANAKEVVQHVHSHMVRVAQLAVDHCGSFSGPSVSLARHHDSGVARYSGKGSRCSPGKPTVPQVAHHFGLDERD